jgi:hypothetical protein
VRIDQEQNLGIRPSQVGFELFVVPRPARWAIGLQRRGDERAAHVRDRGQERWVVRDVGNDAVAGPGGQRDHDLQRLDEIGDAADVVGVR